VEKNVFIPFIHRPVSRYVNAMATNGMYIVEMLEPAPPPRRCEDDFDLGHAFSPGAGSRAGGRRRTPPGPGRDARGSSVRSSGRFR